MKPVTISARLVTFMLTLGASTALLVAQARDAALLEQVSRLTLQLGQPNASDRIDAFYGLVEMSSAPTPSARVGPAVQALMKDYPQRAEDLQASLTKALETENATVKRSSNLDEEYTNYYGDLVTAVVSFNDVRSARALSEAIGTGNMVIRRLASFGQAALEPVLAQLATDPVTGAARDPLSKQGASIVLGLLLDPSNPASIKDPATRNRIKEALKVAARDAAGAYIRTAAVESLARVNDPDVVSFLKDVVTRDSFQATSGKPNSFPVREAAALALAKVGQNTGGAAAAKPAIDALTQIGRDASTPSARDAAAQALTNLATDAQSTAPVRNAARNALQRLGIGAPRAATPPASTTESSPAAPQQGSAPPDTPQAR